MASKPALPRDADCGFPDRKPKDASAKDSKSTKKDKPSRADRGYSDARGPKKKDDWQEFFKDKEPDFSEEGWARRKPKKK